MTHFSFYPGLWLTPKRVKLPKSFLAVNLSDAFTFEDQEKGSEQDDLEMKAPRRVPCTTGVEQALVDATGVGGQHETIEEVAGEESPALEKTHVEAVGHGYPPALGVEQTPPSEVALEHTASSTVQHNEHHP